MNNKDADVLTKTLHMLIHAEVQKSLGIYQNYSDAEKVALWTLEVERLRQILAEQFVVLFSDN